MKKNKTKMSGMPPKISLEVKNFIEEAKYSSSEKKEKEKEKEIKNSAILKQKERKKHEWEKDSLSDKPICPFNLRLSEKEMCKFNFIAQKLDKSKHKILKKIFMPALEELIKKYKDI